MSTHLFGEKPDEKIAAPLSKKADNFNGNPILTRGYIMLIYHI
jgi:hypothetical protein